MDCTSYENQKKLKIVCGDITFGVHGEDFSYIFSYQTGGLESLVMKGKEWLYRTPRPTFWRALTDNDRGNRFHLKSGMWMAADMFLGCAGVRVLLDGREIPLPTAPENNTCTDEDYVEEAEIIFVYQTITVPSTKVEVSYKVEGTGRILVGVHYFGKEGLPELPVFGMRFLMPTKATGYEYQGLSGETYPDRMAGGVPGVYRIEGLPVTRYLVPQDCNVHMDTKWLKIYRNTTLNNADKGTEQFGICIRAREGESFAFSCIPYTAGELENATHQEELPVPRRTVLSVLGAVRGVGGIDSWGADVEEKYHISGEKDIEYSFYIESLQM